MSPAETQELKRQYVIIAAYYQQAISDDALGLYALDLDDLPLQPAVEAMQRLRRQPGRRTYPLPGDIRDAVAPAQGSPVAQANEIAGKITAAITRFGYTNQERAKSFIGELGWLVVCRMGGWRALCTSLLSSEMGTFRAQARDIAKAQLELEATGAPRPAVPQLVAPMHASRAQMTSASAVIASIPALAGRASCRPMRVGPK